MVKYAHEDRASFAARVAKEKGFHGRPPVATRKAIEKRPVEEILAEQIERQDRRASHLFQFGPAEKWRKT